jgi:hypothetical protein
MLMVSIGGQWMVLQGVAWVGMAVSYTMEEGSLGTGLSKTFDGEHPCPLCKAVQKGTQEDGEPANAGEKSAGKVTGDVFAGEGTAVFPPVPMRLAWEMEALKGEASPAAPDLPPPRGMA